VVLQGSKRSAAKRVIAAIIMVMSKLSMSVDARAVCIQVLNEPNLSI